MRTVIPLLHAASNPILKAMSHRTCRIRGAPLPPAICHDQMKPETTSGSRQRRRGCASTTSHDSTFTYRPRHPIHQTLGLFLPHVPHTVPSTTTPTHKSTTTGTTQIQNDHNSNYGSVTQFSTRLSRGTGTESRSTNLVSASPKAPAGRQSSYQRNGQDSQKSES